MRRRLPLAVGAALVAAVLLSAAVASCDRPALPAPNPAYVSADSTAAAEAVAALGRRDGALDRAAAIDSLVSSMEAETAALLAQIRADRARSLATLDALRSDVHALPPDSLARRARSALRDRTGR